MKDNSNKSMTKESLSKVLASMSSSIENDNLETKTRIREEFNMDLILQVNESMVNKTVVFNDGVVIMTPPIDESYWKYRVAVSENQAIVGFPKFHTIGIGFQHEDDWNTNLPYTLGSREIYDHIEHNKQDDSIPPEVCIEAIELIQKTIDGSEWSTTDLLK